MTPAVGNAPALRSPRGVFALERPRWPHLWMLAVFCLPLLGLPFALTGRSGEQWQRISSLSASGPVRQIVWAVTPAQRALYVVVEHWGIFRSDDGGLRWQPLRYRLPRGSLEQIAVGPLALAPDDSQFLLVGVPDQAARGRPPLYKSGNGGQSWVPRRGLGTHDVEGLAIAPGGLAFAASDRRFYRSADAGDSWLEVGTLPVARRVLAMALDGTPGPIYVGTAGDGLVVTPDEGVSWRAALPGRSVYALATAGPGRVYAAADDGLHFSGDRGDSWRQLLPPEAQGAVVALSVCVGPPDVLFVAPAGKPVHYSTDGGTTWRPLHDRLLGAPVTALAASILAEELDLFVGTQRGLWRCTLPAATS